MRNNLLFLCILSFGLHHAPPAKYDFIRKRLKTEQNDSLKIEMLLVMANGVGSNEAMGCAEQALAMSEAVKNQKSMIRSVHTIANIYYNRGDYQQALSNYLKEMKLVEATGNLKKKAGIYCGIGNVYTAQGQYEKALENYLVGVKIIKEHYPEQEQHKLVTYYNNIAQVYFELGDQERSAENYNKVIELNFDRSKRLGAEPDPYSMGTAYSGLGNISYTRKEFDRAEDLYNKALVMYKKTGLNQCIAGALIGLAKVQVALSKFSSALPFYEEAASLSGRENAKTVALEAYQGLAGIYSKTGDHKKAFSSLEKCFVLKDSILNESKLRLMDEMEAKYETAKKDKELILQKAELEKQQADAREKSMQRNIFIGAFIAMALLVFAVFRGYSQKKKANAEISKQKEIIEEKQKEIIDSIRYAKRIQKALITSEKYVERNLGRLTKEN